MRLPLSTDLTSRDGSVAKDAGLKNAFVEIEGQDSAVFKRPAMNTAFCTASGQGQGGIANNSLVFMINADTVHSYNSSGTLIQTIAL